jgi:hypothetical protein
MAWTTPRTWTDGELVTKAIMDPHIRDNFNMTMHTLARKTADETVNNSTTLQNDDHLFFAVAANEVWLVQAWLMWDSAATPDIKFGWTGPASATFAWGALSTETSSGVASFGQSFSGTPVAPLAIGGTLFLPGAGAGTITAVALAGIAAIAGTAGNLQLQWAQNTLNVSDTKVRQNSALIGCRLA